MIFPTLYSILQNRGLFDLVIKFTVFTFHKTKQVNLALFPGKHQNYDCAKFFMKPLGYDNNSSLGHFLFELRGKHNILPIEFEVYFSELFE